MDFRGEGGGVNRGRSDSIGNSYEGSPNAGVSDDRLDPGQ
jgi:hypothetical protein